MSAPRVSKSVPEAVYQSSAPHLQVELAVDIEIRHVPERTRSGVEIQQGPAFDIDE